MSVTTLRDVRYRVCVSGLLVLATVVTGTLEGQTTSTWIVGGVVGRYEVHEGFGDIGAPSGLLVGFSAGRQWGPLRLQVVLGQGIGDDQFTLLEPGLQLVAPYDSPVRAVAGVGAGFMMEGSLSLPYYGEVGLEARLTPRAALRATVRRGAHANTGDSGTFRGPHAIALGFVWSTS